MWFLTFLSWIAGAVYFVTVIMSIRSIGEADASERILPVLMLLTSIALLAVLKIWVPLAKNSRKPWLLGLGSLPALLLLAFAFLRANPCFFSSCEEKKNETNINSPRREDPRGD